MQKLMNFRKNKKAFTLVEIIVVLVILAILAAVGIPSMIGFIDDAKGKAYIAEARAAYVASQMVASETYGTTGSATETINVATSGGTDVTGSSAEKIRKLLGTDVPGAVRATVATGKVTQLLYLNGGYLVTITPGTNGSSPATITKATAMPTP